MYTNYKTENKKPSCW